VEDCVFCKIIAGELPSLRIHEDERAIAILDIAPATAGHALVLPRSHARDVHDTPDDDVAHCAVVAKRVASMAMERLHATGVTIMQSNGADAWQTVFHYHVHVIPRYPGDPLRLPWTPAAAEMDELARISRTYFSD
jgi:histidine triad (HIT) family protein